MPKLWERQVWDTPASYDRFSTYYLVQTPPRSLDAAYRTYQQHKGNRQVTKATRSSSHWRRWYAGRDSQGGDIPGAIGWDDRSTAWDDHEASLLRRRQTREREQRARDLQVVATNALHKISQTWAMYKPRSEEMPRLGELTHALSTIAKEIRASYDLTPGQGQADGETWRSEIADLIREGKLTYADVQEEMGDELARELFEYARASSSEGS